MTWRSADEQRGAVRIKATLCSAFNIGWADYGQLTRRERALLIELHNEMHGAPAEED